eukprot:PhF_6_TR34187/c0_g1_i1/m.50057
MFDEAGITNLLNSNGITKATPKPTYEKLPMIPTAHCIAWRQTGGCDADGPNEPNGDQPCIAVIESGWSGYCECKEGQRYGVGCAHDAFQCEDMCKERIASASNPAKEDL